MSQINEDKFLNMSTKISPATAKVWNAICDSMGTDTYHMLQNFIYTMIRAAADPHGLNPDIQKILTMLEADAGWQFMCEANMTECTDDILERVCEVTMHGIYRRLRMLGARMGCQNLSDVLLTMIDAQTVMQLDGELQDELPQAGDRAENGKAYAYGKKTKSKHRRTVDSLANSQQRIQFTDEDREQADEEAQR